MTARMIVAIEEILVKEKPDALLVYGDTNSTLAAGLAAVKLRVPVLHVEAGNRLGTLDNPEEVTGSPRTTWRLWTSAPPRTPWKS